MSETKERRIRPRIGDVVRITSRDGAAFAQYTHKSEEFGALVRVLGPAPTISKRVDDPVAIAAGPTQFVTFFPLGAACHRGIAQVLGSAPIPKEFHEFPRFRQALRLDPRSTAPCNWMIWDGREEWVIPRLNEEQRRYPIRSIVNDTLLVERALSGWTSDLDT
jgi:hypothetical protein